MKYALPVSMLVLGAALLAACAYTFGQPNPFVPGMEYIGLKTLGLLSVVGALTAAAGLLNIWAAIRP